MGLGHRSSLSEMPPARWRAAPRFSSLRTYIKSPRSRRSPQRHEILQHGRNEFRDRWVNVHRAPQDRGRRLGIHDIENAVNDLVARNSEQRRTENLLRLLVDQDLHEALGLAFLVGPADVLHGH